MEAEIEFVWRREDERVVRRGGAAAGRVRRIRRLVVWRSAGVAVSLIQVVENFANDFVLSNEGNDAQGTTTITFQRVDLNRRV